MDVVDMKMTCLRRKHVMLKPDGRGIDDIKYNNIPKKGFLLKNVVISIMDMRNIY